MSHLTHRITCYKFDCVLKDLCTVRIPQRSGLLSQNGETIPADVFLNQLRDSVSAEECGMTNSITQNKIVLGKGTPVSMNCVG